MNNFIWFSPCIAEALIEGPDMLKSMLSDINNFDSLGEFLFLPFLLLIIAVFYPLFLMMLLISVFMDLVISLPMNILFNIKVR